ncbi:MAG: transcriptional regulator, partial [Thermoanaerobaculia bacterium]
MALEAKMGAVEGVFLFGPFRLDVRERALLRDGEPVPITPKAFDLLTLLVRSAGRVVLRTELQDALWPDTIVEEANINFNMSAVRKALGDAGNAPLYIETVRGHGYRFLATVRTEEAETGKGEIRTHEAPPGLVAPSAHPIQPESRLHEPRREGRAGR